MKYLFVIAPIFLLFWARSLDSICSKMTFEITHYKSYYFGEGMGVAMRAKTDSGESALIDHNSVLEKHV